MSFAGATRAPLPHAGTIRSGGFGGARGLADWLRANGIRGVIDATHPFAARISAHAAAATDDLGVPLLHLRRPPWPADPSWRIVADLDAAAAAIAPGSRVLLATGHRSAAAFAPRRDIEAWVRTAETPATPCPIRQGRWLVARPPFTLEAEMRLLKDLRADTVVARNSGGETGREKLDAAGSLGLDIIVVARPTLPGTDRAETANEAREWAAWLR